MKRASFRITDECLLDVLRSAGADIPADAEVRGASYDAWNGSVVLCLSSDEFEPVAEGCTAPNRDFSPAVEVIPVVGY
jgi:hypothetical protein